MSEVGPAHEHLRRQRSHVLLVLSNAKESDDAALVHWYHSAYRERVLDIAGVLRVHHYGQHELDITRGRHPRLPFRYLGLHELSIDGAEAAGEVIEQVLLLHRVQAVAGLPATWLFYPMSEKVGRDPRTVPSQLTIAFANGIPGREAEFREWYATRHIRHALNIPALVSGQCFERTQFQRPNGAEASFSMIAIYEQDSPAEEVLASLTSLPPETFRFPALDTSRFAEAVFRPA